MTNNKSLERADIIAALRCCGNTDTKRPDCEHCPLNGHMCVKRMLEGAADLLERDTEPPNDPLTLEELRGQAKEGRAMPCKWEYQNDGKCVMGGRCLGPQCPEYEPAQEEGE